MKKSLAALALMTSHAPVALAEISFRPAALVCSGDYGTLRDANSGVGSPLQIMVRVFDGKNFFKPYTGWNPQVRLEATAYFSSLALPDPQKPTDWDVQSSDGALACEGIPESGELSCSSGWTNPTGYHYDFNFYVTRINGKLIGTYVQKPETGAPRVTAGLDCSYPN